MHSLMLLARLLANRHNLEVVVDEKAATAKTTRTQLTLPLAWVNAIVPDDGGRLTELLEGVIDHEAAGHARHTDFDVYEACEAQAGPLKRRVLMILEDLRAERLASAVYPGIARNLARTVELLCANGSFGNPAEIDRDGPAQTFVTAMLCVGRAMLLQGQEAPLRALKHACEAWAARTCPELWVRVTDIMQRAWAAPTTADVAYLAEAVMMLLRDFARGEPLSPLPSEAVEASADAGAAAHMPGADDTAAAESDRSGDESDTKPETASENNTAAEGGDPDAAGDSTNQDDGSQNFRGSSDVDDETPRGYGEMPTSTGNGAAPDAREQAFALSALVQQDVARASDLGELVGQALGSAVADLPEKNRYCAPAQGSGEVPVPVAWAVTGNQIRSRLAHDLEALLESRRSVHHTVGIVGRRLIPSRLHRVAILDPRVFRRRCVEDGVDVAVSLLVDVSGSMGKNKGGGFVPLEAAGGTLVALATLLELYDIPFEAALFNGGVCTIKSFEDNWKRVAHLHKAIPILGGSTALAPALEVTLGRIAVRDEERRIIIVILDGATPDMARVAALYADAQEIGVEIATVLIASLRDRYVAPYAQMLRKLGKQPSLTDSMETLAKTVLDEVRALL